MPYFRCLATLLLTLTLVLALAGCPSEEPQDDDTNVTDDDDATPGDDDDDVTGDDDSATVDGVRLEATTANGVSIQIDISEDIIEAVGVAAEDFTIELLDADPALLPDDDAVLEVGGSLIRLGPEGTQFPTPLVMTLSVPSELLDDEHPVPAVALWVEENNRWEALPTVWQKNGIYQLQVPLEHFSLYDIFATPPFPAVSVVASLGGGQLGSLQFDGYTAGVYSLTDVLQFVRLDTEGVEVEVVALMSPDTDSFLWPNIDLDAGTYDLQCILGWPVNT